jgi:hypothetical protein
MTGKSKPTTHVLMCVDMSGSMATLAGDVRGGFNTYVADLAKDTARYRFTVTLFDTELIPLCVKVKPGDVPQLTAANYAPRGMTALLDAVGKTVTEFEAANPTLAEGDRVLLVIQTDGLENSSREFTFDSVKKLITEREAGGRWTVVYLGAGADTWNQAARMGVANRNYVNTAASSVGTRSSYSGLTSGTTAYAAGAQSVAVAAAVAGEPGATV